MPIYEYRCGSCGFQSEYLRKISDDPLKVCPECGLETFSKLVSAAGFQLKGSGWYATDFKGKGARPAAKEASEPKESTQEGKAPSSDEGKTGGCGSACACHN